MKSQFLLSMLLAGLVITLSLNCTTNSKVEAENNLLGVSVLQVVANQGEGPVPTSFLVDFLNLIQERGFEPVTIPLKKTRDMYLDPNIFAGERLDTLATLTPECDYILEVLVSANVAKAPTGQMGGQYSTQVNMFSRISEEKSYNKLKTEDGSGETMKQMEDAVYLTILDGISTELSFWVREINKELEEA